MYSPTGASWSSSGITGVPNTDFLGVIYADGKFVAVGQIGGQTMYSADGVTWTADAAERSGSLKSVTYGNGKFVAVGDNYYINSVDGITWSEELTDGMSGGYDSVTYGNNTYVAVSTANALMWSIYGNDESSSTVLTTTDNTNYNLFSAGDAVVEKHWWYSSNKCDY